MQLNSTNRKVRNRLIAVALFVLCFLQLSAQGQEQDRQVTLIQDTIVGLVPGQTLRFTLFNPQGSPRMNGHVKVFNGGGDLVFQTAEVEIAPGEFHSFNIDRADIGLPGELRTGRFQIRARLLGIRRASAQEPGESGRASIDARVDKLPRSIELIDNETGKTVASIPISSIPISSIPHNSAP